MLFLTTCVGVVLLMLAAARLRWEHQRGGGDGGEVSDRASDPTAERFGTGRPALALTDTPTNTAILIPTPSI
jgi:hypothetical protein